MNTIGRSGLFGLLILGAVTSGSGSILGSTHDETGQESVPPSSPTPGSSDFQVDLILGLIPDDQLNAYLAQVNLDNETALQGCMNDAGFEYEPEPFVPDPTLAAMTSVEVAREWGFGIYTELDQNDESMNEAIRSEMSESELSAWDVVRDDCYELAWSNAETPLSPEVQQALSDMKTAVDNDPRVLDAEDDWGACMASSGFPFSDRIEMIRSIRELGEPARLRETRAWEEQSLDHEEWIELVEIETSTAVANAVCFPPVRDVRTHVVEEIRPQLADVWILANTPESESGTDTEP